MNLTLNATIEDAPNVRSITWLHRPGDNTQYRVTFEGPLTAAVAARVNDYAADYPVISGAVADPDDPNVIIVQCTAPDSDHEALAWLQDGLMPSIPLTGIARVCLAAQPVVARIGLIGEEPLAHQIQHLLRLLNALPTVESARYATAVKEVHVIYAGDPPAGAADEAALGAVLALQKIVALTVLMDRETIPEME